MSFAVLRGLSQARDSPRKRGVSPCACKYSCALVNTFVTELSVASPDPYCRRATYRLAKDVTEELIEGWPDYYPILGQFCLT